MAFMGTQRGVIPSWRRIFLLCITPCYSWIHPFGHCSLNHIYTRHKKSFQLHSTYTAPAPPPQQIINGTVTILKEGEHFLVASKPPGVVCHHSGFTGSRSKKQKTPQIPMLQRVRKATSEHDHDRVNLIHRLDRGASGCLLFSRVNNSTLAEEEDPTCTFQQAMTEATKTYVALVRGEGILHGEDLKERGWFNVTRPIKNQKGVVKDATTFIRFVAGQDDGRSTVGVDRPRAGLVLARPVTGRWHQVRRHLNGLSHPILGDSSHGNSHVNREWRDQRGLPYERCCLHLARLQVPETPYCKDGIDVSCPLPEDMMGLLETHLPQVLKDAEPILLQEGIDLRARDDTGTRVLPFQYAIRQ